MPTLSSLVAPDVVMTVVMMPALSSLVVRRLSLWQSIVPPVMSKLASLKFFIFSAWAMDNHFYNLALGMCKLIPVRPIKTFCGTKKLFILIVWNHTVNIWILLVIQNFAIVVFKPHFTTSPSDLLWIRIGCDHRGKFYVYWSAVEATSVMEGRHGNCSNNNVLHLGYRVVLWPNLSLWV